jgi:integrase
VERHRSGQARARWSEGGRPRERWFGPWGSDEARRRYAEFRAEWSANHGPPAEPDEAAFVGDLVARFLRWARGRYVKHGRLTSSLYLYRAAARELVERFAELPGDAFRPAHLRQLRAAWVAAGLGRDTANRYAARVVRVFAWGVTESLVPAAVLAPLKGVEPLVPGQTGAPEPEPVAAVGPDVVERTVPHLHPDPGRRAVLEAMVRTQLLTGVRPGELCAMRPEMFDRSGVPWRYDPGAVHKNFHRGRPREPVYVGPRGRAVLGPVLDQAEPGRPLWRFPPLRLGRRTAVTRIEYGRFVLAACARAGVGPWTPNQLRHTRATAVHDHYQSDEAAAAALGNTPEVARRVYVDSPGDRLARRVAEETG